MVLLSAPARFDLANIDVREGAVTADAVAVRVFSFEVVGHQRRGTTGNNDVSSNALDMLGLRHAADLGIMLFAAAAAVYFHRRAEVRAHIFQHRNEFRRNAVESAAATTCKLTDAEMLT